MSKVRKHHNPVKRAKRILSNTRLWSWESMIENGTRIAYGESFYWPKWVSLSQQQVNSLVQRPQNWALCFRAIYLHKDGSFEIESETAIGRDLRVNDFGQLQEGMRRRIVKQLDIDKICDVGWICQSFHSEEQLDKINLEMINLDPITQLRKLKWEQHYRE